MHVKASKQSKNIEIKWFVNNILYKRDLSIFGNINVTIQVEQGKILINMCFIDYAFY